MAEKGMRSGEVARAAGVSTDTLRFYERRGLLPRPKRLANGYRAYGAQALDRVLLIQRALSVGFTLEEIARFVKARGRGSPPCREVRALAARKLEEIQSRIQEMRAFQKTLEETVEEFDARLAAAGEGEPARLLESLRPTRNTSGSALSALAFNRRRSREIS
ncbi:MAG: heavy metal-responsive transcriptional regulator [Acidobacteria bacterium]|nr:heavy metal-responsive transcriptional regulator [Acidobacteriota bacterium]MCA1612392.1 heavy metal-responsive transcriptional regulator [Acidobacteriota bacterium]